MDEIQDAVILGAGIAGTSMAHAMASRGWRTLLLDQGTFPRHKACGEFLSPEARGSLDWLGLTDRLVKLQPAVIDKVQLFAPSGASLTIRLPEPAMGLSRYTLDHALLQAAREQGAVVRTETQILSVRPLSEGYEIETKSQEGRQVLRARAVLGAWGRQRRQGLAGAKRERDGTPGQLGVSVQLEGLQIERTVELYLYAGGYVGLAPIEQGRANAAAIIDRPNGSQDSLKFLGWLEQAADRNPALRARLSGAAPLAGTEQAVAPVRPTASPEAWGLVPHLGDAAMIIPPFCGDGMAMALRTVELCTPLANAYLKDALSLAEWRTAYTAALQTQMSGPLRWGSLLQAALRRPALFSLLLRTGHYTPGLALRAFQSTRLASRKTTKS